MFGAASIRGENWGGSTDMNFNLRKSLTTVLTAIMAFTIVSTATAAENETSPKDIYRIVALGDSITVGYEPGMTASSVAYGYVDRLYEQSLFHKRSELANYAIMGLTTPGLIHLLQGAADGKPLTSSDLQDFSSFRDGVAQQADAVAGKTPQIASDLAKANLIVMTIGANDFGDFITTIIKETTEDARKYVQDNFDNLMNKYTADLDKMIRQVHSLAPNAKILLADQYLPLPKIHPLYDDLVNEVQKLSNKLDVIAEGLSKEGIPVEIVHVSKEFFGKESTYAHIAVLETERDNHPTQAGYEAIAQAFSKSIWQQYLVPAPRKNDVIPSVIINGKELLSPVIIKNNTTFLGLRDVKVAVGAELSWTQKTKTAVFSKNGREVTITIGAKSIIVNGVSQPLATPAYFQQVGKELRTYVPLAVISNNLDYQVIFRKKPMAVFINS
jgi:lysophospholipase L1-like esterase